MQVIRNRITKEVSGTAEDGGDGILTAEPDEEAVKLSGVSVAEFDARARRSAGGDPGCTVLHDDGTVEAVLAVAPSHAPIADAVRSRRERRSLRLDAPVTLEELAEAERSRHAR